MRELVMKGTSWPTMMVACWLLRARIEGRDKISVLPTTERARMVAEMSGAVTL